MKSSEENANMFCLAMPPFQFATSLFCHSGAFETFCSFFSSAAAWAPVTLPVQPNYVIVPGS
jgi:hypothetical protein